MDHAVPFQCSMSVRSKECWPTTQQSDAEAHVTSKRRLSCPVLVLGEVTMDHAVPFECRSSVSAAGAALPLAKSAWASQYADEPAEMPPRAFIWLAGCAVKM